MNSVDLVKTMRENFAFLSVSLQLYAKSMRKDINFMN